MNKLIKRAYTFSDLCLVPRMSTIKSRLDVNLETYLTRQTKVAFPLVPSNMDTVISPELSSILIENGSYPINHRFSPLDDQLQFVTKFEDKCYISAGVVLKNEEERLDKLLPYARGVCFDVAHGHTDSMIEAIKYVKRNYPDKEVIAGNICTREAYEDLANVGADALKIGVGPGCFSGDTRILMSNGTYKNIKDIEEGNEIINKNGIPKLVKRKIYKGKRKVIKIKNGLSYKYTTVTPDHNFWIGDLSSSSDECISSCGIAKLLDKMAKTKPKTSKYKWQEIGKSDKKKTMLLFPNDIKWNLSDNLNIDMTIFSKKYKLIDKIVTSKNYSINKTITESYDLGYIFGTYLGDGHARIYVNNANKTECGDTCWYFGGHEIDIAKKLNDCIKNVFGINSIIKKLKDKNVILVKQYNKNITKLLLEFSKKTGKHLPSKYYCLNKEYIKGIYDGLIDSDGHREKSKVCNNIDIFMNTSTHLIELFNWCCINLNKSFGSFQQKSSCGLKNFNTDNLCDSYRVKTHSSNRFTKNYIYTRILDITDDDDEEDVWDLEIDCDTHSFIADNVIVHNSACSTRRVTGMGVPQLSAIMDCAEAFPLVNVPIIADGGVESSGEVAKALAAGAHTVMMGKLFSKTFESAAKKFYWNAHSKTYYPIYKINENMQLYVKYRGQASSDFQNEFYGAMRKGIAPEGEAFYTPISSSVQQIIDKLNGGLRSSMTMSGARTIEEFQENAIFREVLPGYQIESSIRKD